MADLVSLRLDNAAIQRLMESPQGPVIRHAMIKGDEVKRGARRRVGVSDPSQRSTRPGGSQHLRDTINKRLVQDGQGAAVYVGDLDDSVPHARFHHDGTRPHVIRPVRAKMLRFTVGGRVVFAMQVSHPGTRPNPYLVDAARAAGLKVEGLHGGRRARV